MAVKRESLDGQKHKFKSLKRVLNQYTSDLSDIDFCRAVHSVIYGNLLDDKLLGTFAGNAVQRLPRMSPEIVVDLAESYAVIKRKAKADDTLLHAAHEKLFANIATRLSQQFETVQKSGLLVSSIYSYSILKGDMGEEEQTGLIERIQRRLEHGTMEPQELRRLPSALSAIGLADRAHIENATKFIIDKTGSGEMSGKELLAFMRRAEQLSSTKFLFTFN